MSTTYNGFSNYATWNICLWTDNEESSYRTKCRLLKQAHEPLKQHDVMYIAKVCLPHGTPDLSDEKGCRWADVNWLEVAEHWEDERQELIG